MTCIPFVDLICVELSTKAALMKFGWLMFLMPLFAAEEGRRQEAIPEFFKVDWSMMSKQKGPECLRICVTLTNKRDRDL